MLLLAGPRQMLPRHAWACAGKQWTAQLGADVLSLGYGPGGALTCQHVIHVRQWALPLIGAALPDASVQQAWPEGAFARHAGYTYVILVTRTKRNAILRYRLVRPNTIFQPLQGAHFLTRNYKKVA